MEPSSRASLLSILARKSREGMLMWNLTPTMKLMKGDDTWTRWALFFFLPPFVVLLCLLNCSSHSLFLCACVCCVWQGQIDGNVVSIRFVVKKSPSPVRRRSPPPSQPFSLFVLLLKTKQPLDSMKIFAFVAILSSPASHRRSKITSPRWLWRASLAKVSLKTKKKLKNYLSSSFFAWNFRSRSHWLFPSSIKQRAWQGVSGKVKIDNKDCTHKLEADFFFWFLLFLPWGQLLHERGRVQRCSSSQNRPEFEEQLRGWPRCGCIWSTTSRETPK